MSKFLEGKVALVTGSGQGVGRAIALGLAAAGAKVVTNNRAPGRNATEMLTPAAIAALTQEELDLMNKRYDEVGGDAETTANTIKGLGGSATPFFADIADFDKSKELVDFAVKTYGKLDIIANIAGGFGFGSVTEISEEMWNRVTGVKPKGYFNVIHHAAPYMIERKYGRIINTTSRAFLGDWILHPEYCAANAGVVGLTRAVAIELFSHNITCNAFEPFARTRASIDLEVGANSKAGNQVLMPGLQIPSFDFSPPPDGIAPFICYLASDKAAHISGSIFSLAGNSIGVYSTSEIKANITKYAKELWTQEELEFAVPMNLLRGYTSIADPANAH
ncbi:MAG: SDR family NAD(P)-dependent oxidoreductase [Oscillospiraceae bacterium]|jgi:3-oxoacyl-[acyl-carrier protein] reductase|nr:SDR family NAD(P)-dependent oxidoreductase [Oscillospiraceae bacterium]